jgi:class 3 adenylate cyclase
MPAGDERKPVTVLFADVAGSTELATRHDPEHLRALLAAFFDEMRQQVEAYGGTVEKYAGDAVVAVFGVPQVHEDDAERAVRTAVAMRDGLAQLNPMFEQEYGVRLALRIGVATGEAVAASRPVSEFMVTGDVPNLAARLQSLADGITLSEETHRLVAALLDAEPTGPHQLKGFARPVTAWRVRALRATESRPRGIPGLSSPVVGRDREIGALRTCLEELQRGRGQVVTIVGEAGIGKSRVKIELRENLPAGARWIEGRCQSYTQSTSYAPIAEVLRTALGLGAAEAPAIARTKLRVALRALAGERMDQVQGALAHLLSVDLGREGVTTPPDPRALQSQLVLGARAVLEGLALRGPLIVAVEDLHWADAASAELLTVLLELTDTHPVMILVTARPEMEGEAWTFRLHAERNYGHRLSELRLAPLPAADSERLADNLLRVSDLPEAVRRHILDRAEGNPFFLEEIIRALIEHGVLRREEERWVAAGDPDGWPVPTTLRGVLTARIDRLPAAAKTALQRAAVVGRFFEYRALQSLSNDSNELDRALTHLLRAELIREWARLPERQYLFKHALTQEAAYASILVEQRKVLHGQVARHLEEAFGETSPEHAAVLAYHWDRAHDWEHALRYTLRAAERARALYAQPEATQHHWHALELLGRLPTTPATRRIFVDLVRNLVTTPGWARTEGERQQGLGLIEEALSTAADLDDLDALAYLEAVGGRLRGDEGALRRALARGAKQPMQATITFQYCAYLGWAGRYDDALVQARRATRPCRSRPAGAAGAHGPGGSLSRSSTQPTSARSPPSWTTPGSRPGAPWRPSRCSIWDGGMNSFASRTKACPSPGRSANQRWS